MNESSTSGAGGDVDSKLDSLIMRIQAFGGEAERPKQQPRPAAGTNPISRPPVPTEGDAATEGGLPSSPSAASAGGAVVGPSAMASGPSSGPSLNRSVSSIGSVLPSSPSQIREVDATTNAAGFTPSRDEPWRPPEPHDIRSAGVNESILEASVYRFLLSMGEAEGRQVAAQVKLPFRMIEPLMARLKMEQNVAYKNATATNDYVYVLTENGRNVARNYLTDSTYYGACPVTLKSYVASVRHQTLEGQQPKKKELIKAFRDLLISPKMLNKLGPAVASGRGMFLFGFPGNGKTSIAERVTGAFGKYIWVPRAVDVEGEVLRVFDPMCHNLAMPEATSGLLDVQGYDKRWVRIERPTIIAGGELTMDMLEVQLSPQTNISESPMQLKSNCGTLVIDDFGRQKMPVEALLNRWIVPLEKRYDFLSMSSGKKIQVPFDQLVIFSTNLEPKDLVDDAFLRRIPYKIEAKDPPESDFRELCEIMCKSLGIPYNPDAIDYLIETHFRSVGRPMRMCQPRDLLLQVKSYCLYNDIAVELKNDYLDFACDNYFSLM